MTGYRMAGHKFFQERQFLRADVLTLPAAGVERASRWGVDGARHVACEDDALTFGCGIERKAWSGFKNAEKSRYAR